MVRIGRFVIASVLAATAGCGGARSAPRLSPRPPPGSQPLLKELGLAGVAHHLEQHPEADCRLDWRPRALAWEPQWSVPAAQSIRDTALSYEGTRYRYGGTGVNGFDCSGFVNKVYANHGYDLPRTSRAQYAVGLKVPRSQLQPGDLVFFWDQPAGHRIGHVGIYLGEDRFIHAVSGRGLVTFDPLSNRYYRERYAGARRVLALPPGRYSTRTGEARAGVAFDDLDDIRAKWSSGPGPCLETEFLSAR